MQLGWLFRGLRSGIVTTRYPRGPMELPDGFRGMPLPDVRRCQAAEGCDACQRACLPDAIMIQRLARGDAVDRFTLHYGRCILCGLCVSACPHDAMSMSPRVDLSSRRLDDLIFVTDLNGTGERVNDATPVVHDNGHRPR